MWQYVSINRCPSGFGQFQAGERGDVYATLTDLLADSDFEIFELLDGSPLPEGAEDIRGQIRSEPDRVFCYAPPGSFVHYFGAVAVKD